jgi:predicted MFS family arabinose efflux permease
MAARVLEGITGGSISTAQAYIADVTPPEDRMKRFGLIGAVFGLGFILGPAFGGFLSRWGLAAPAYAAGTLCLVAAVFGYFLLPESLPVEKRSTKGMRLADANPFGRIAHALSRDSIRTILIAVFVVNVAFSGLQSNFAVYTMKRFGMGPQENAWIFVYIGTLSIFMQGVVVRRLPKTIPPVATSIAGLTAMAVGFFGISAAAQPWHLAPALGVMAIGNGLAAPMLTGLVSRRVGEREQGSVLGSTQAILSSTRIVGPLAAGLVFDALGAGAPYWTGGLLALAAAGIVWRTPKA